MTRVLYISLILSQMVQAASLSVWAILLLVLREKKYPEGISGRSCLNLTQLGSHALLNKRGGGSVADRFHQGKRKLDRGLTGVRFLPTPRSLFFYFRSFSLVFGECRAAQVAWHFTFSTTP